jgi:hypothetical protein
MKKSITLIVAGVLLWLAIVGTQVYDVVVKERTKVCEAIGYVDYSWSQDGCLQEEGVMKIYVDYAFVLERLGPDG